MVNLYLQGRFLKTVIRTAQGGFVVSCFGVSVCIAAVFPLAGVIALPAMAENLVPNGSFECGVGSADGNDFGRVDSWFSFCERTADGLKPGRNGVSWQGTLAGDSVKEWWTNLGRPLCKAAPSGGGDRWAALDVHRQRANHQCHDSQGKVVACAEIGATQVELTAPLVVGERYVLKFSAATRAPIIGGEGIATGRGTLRFYISDQLIVTTPQHYETGSKPQVWCTSETFNEDEPTCSDSNCGVQILKQKIEGRTHEWHEFSHEFVPTVSALYLAITTSIDGYDVALDKVSIVPRSSSVDYPPVCCDEGPAVAAFSLPDEVCPGEPVVLNATASQYDDAHFYEVAEADYVGGPYNNGEYWASSVLPALNPGPAGILTLTSGTPISFGSGRIYRVKVAVQNECTPWDEAIDYVTVLPGPTVTIAPDPADLCNGPVVLVPTPSGGTPPFTYSWGRTSWYPPMSFLLGEGATLEVFDPGIYDCFVRDANGCVGFADPVEVTGSLACFPPPGKMAGWWPLNEGSGPTAEEISRYSDTSHPGTHIGSPTVIAGQVGNALELDGTNYVSVPHAARFNIGSPQGSLFSTGDPDHGDFSIDAWVRVDQLSPGFTPVVTKGLTCFDSVNPTSYAFGLTPQGLLSFTVVTATGSAGFTSNPGSPVPLGTWSHLAVSLDRDQPDGVRFYLDGLPVGVADPTGLQGGVSTSAPLLLGRVCATENTHVLVGAIDEVEVFRKPLQDQEVLALAKAGECAFGKCRQFIAGASQLMLCPGEGSGTYTVRICNNGASSRTYDLSVTGLPAGTYSDIGYCDVEGPQTISISPSQVTVDPGACQAASIMVTRPTGLTGSGQRAGYQVTMTDATTSEPLQRRGVIVEAPSLWCPISAVCLPCPSDSSGVGHPVVECGVDYGFEFAVLNLDDIPRVLNFELRAVDTFGASSSILGINGGPSGQSATGAVNAPAGGAGTVQFDARFEASEPFNPHQLQLWIQVDSLGTLALLSTIDVSSAGKVEPVACSATWSETPAAAPSPRHSHSTVYDVARNEVLLFGGYDGTNRLNDTWVWNGASWSQRFPALSPSPRGSPGLAYDGARNVVVLHGGSLDGGLYSNETWEWDGTDWSPAGTSGPQVSNMGITYDSIRQVTVLYGGSAATGRSRDTWEYDGSTWTLLTNNSPPGYRSGHRLVYVEHLAKAFMFGGQTPGNVDTRDNWTFDGTTWSNLGAGGPAVRQLYAMAYDSDRHEVYLYGGVTGATNYADFWRWQDGTWSLVSSASDPGGVQSSDMEYVPGEATLVLFGGHDGAPLGATWLYGCPGPLPIMAESKRSGASGILLHASPNPFLQATSISFRVDRATVLQLGIFDVSGRLIKRFDPIVSRGPGTQAVLWDGRDPRGRLVAPGVFFARVEGPGMRETIRLVRLP